MWERPTTGKFPVDRLRRQLASAMELEVIFSPKFVLNKPTVRTDRKVLRSNWDVAPLWRVAPKSAHIRSNRIASLLHLLVTYGWKCPPNKLSHLLERLSINIWKMTDKSFFGLYRSIRSVVLLSEQKSRPLLRCGALSNNPIITIEYFLKPRRKHCLQRQFGCMHLPKLIWLAARLKNHEVQLT